MAWDSNTSWNAEKDLINVSKDTTDSGLEILENPKYKKFVEKTNSIIYELEDIGLTREKKQSRVVTFKSFNAAVFLKHIFDREEVDELLLVVYSINHEAAKMINDMVNKQSIKTKILMSNLRNKAHRKKEQLTRDMYVENPNIDLYFDSAHSKIKEIKTKKGNYYILKGSGNLSFNSRVEQYVIDNDKELFNFTKDWMRKIKVFLKGKKELVLT